MPGHELGTSDFFSNDHDIGECVPWAELHRTQSKARSVEIGFHLFARRNLCRLQRMKLNVTPHDFVQDEMNDMQRNNRKPICRRPKQDDLAARLEDSVELLEDLDDLNGREVFHHAKVIDAI